MREPGTGISAEEDSLVENIQRAPLHPLDQFRAFKSLRDSGLTEEEIAARFFVPVKVVKQRLRLLAVSPALIEIYAEEGMTLEQLMAFTVSGDHARQDQVWQALQHSWSKEAYQIRRMLTDNAVRACDRRVQFVTIKAYEEAGGTVMRDLFEDDGGGWVEDVPLLERLVSEKLKTEAHRIAEEGWKWIEVAVDLPYGHQNGLRALKGTRVEPAADELATITALEAEYARLEAEHQDAEELPDEIDQRLGEIETSLAALEDWPVFFDPEEVARAGVFVSIGRDGRLAVDRGYVRPEDEAAEGAVCATDEISSGRDNCAHRAAILIAGPMDAQHEEREVKALPERLLGELTAHRTIALRDALASNPHVALTALLHKFVLDIFAQGPTPGCLEASVRQVGFPVQADDLKDSPAAQAIAGRQEAWKAILPADEDLLWDRLDALDGTGRAALLAHCVSFGVNALYERPDRYGGGATAQSLQRRMRQADRLARSLGMDMAAAGWRPTVDNYLGRVTKHRILDAVREAKGEATVELIAHLKKTDMAREAERLLDGTGWLPEPLRLSDIEPEPEANADEAADLPAFLAGGGDEDPLVPTEAAPADMATGQPTA